jgi:hypothetical protein
LIGFSNGQLDVSDLIATRRGRRLKMKNKKWGKA